jgi:carbon-monoxide dehydrogenase medium subunit
VKPVPFSYEAPVELEEALGLLAQHGDEAKLLAGGQSLMPMLNLRLARPRLVVDINRVGGLEHLLQDDGSVSIGALVRQRALERWARERVPLIDECLRHVGHLAIRNRGTVVGSIVHADPAAELPALFLCCDGVVTARSPSGARRISARELYRAPLTTSLRPDEMATEVRLTLPGPGTGWGFAEVARRHGDFALVGAVALLACADDGRVRQARLGLFGVGGTPVRAEAAEALLAGAEPTPARVREAARAAADVLRPDPDLHATAEYRRRVAAVLLERTMTGAVARCRRAA